MLSRKHIFLAVIFVSVFIAAHAIGIQQYGILHTTQQDAVKQMVKHDLDSLMHQHPMLKNKTIIYSIAQPHKYLDRTIDFYLLLLLILLLGLVRLSDPKYFPNLWQTFKSPNLGSRQHKDKIEGATLQNLLMNLFFTFSLGAYLFYLLRYIRFRDTSDLPLTLLLLMTAGVAVVYTAKYAVIRFSGWVFRVENITDNYIFNVFFINKIIGVVLLPFTLVLAFAHPQWAQPALIISGLLVSVLFVGRYVRSWQVFGSFFQYSKFHFFMYLCASELLPLAVLMKLLVRGLL